MARYPERIVCLTEETTETLYLLGEQARIAGISGFTVRPPQARREKPRVSAFTSAKIGKILALEPDLVLGFSDIQADIAAELVRHGVEVHVFNHRTVAGILRMIETLGAMIGCAGKAYELAERLAENVRQIERKAARLPRRPRVYFEEWDAPMISGIGWVAELVRSAGGDDIFPELARESLAKNRIIADHAKLVERAPDIILGSWCGKKFRPEKVAARPGFGTVPAVANGDLHEVKSSIILQPGPAALTDGVEALYAIIARWSMKAEQADA
ncbi:MAG TPA: ABC transporter substrate-binding protein [Gammaproteobacteria bacterium]|nr:ABC transporter substrate-binding protein [Gammaproteobacteria bacterium]